MSPITTHVLDTARGLPAAGVGIVLERQQDAAWQLIGRGETDDDGRQRALVPDGVAAPAGVYRLRFDTRTYFAAQSMIAFFPEITVMFEVAEGRPHHHVPLLLSPFGYTTYRGS